MKLTFKNWEQYNKRAKEYKHPVWFSFQNDFAINRNFFDFSDQNRLIFIYLLCEASRCNENGDLEIEIDHFAYITRQKPKDIIETIEKLEQKQILEVQDRIGIVPGSYDDPAGIVSGSYGDRTGIATEQDRTEQNRTGQNKSRGGDKHPTRTSGVGSEIWKAYQEAYRGRYGVDPVRNATTNSQCAALAKRLGESAVEVVRFYLTHNDGYYLRSQHPIGLCLAQAESLHTQWQRGVAVTANQVRQFENQHTTKSAVEEALEIMNRRNEQ